jgi:hypothetical protein
MKKKSNCSSNKLPLECVWQKYSRQQQNVRGTGAGGADKKQKVSNII